MEQKEIKQYLKGLNFGLNDYDKTFNRYQNYKAEDFKTFLTCYSEDIKTHFEDLKELIKAELKQKNCMNFDLTKKTYIRLFKTWVNSITYNLDYSFIKSLCNDSINKNTIKNFNIKFYLTFYNDINNIMQEVLKDFVIEYPKRAIINKMV